MSSDSSEDENLERIREATDSTFLKNSFYNGKVNKQEVLEEKKIELPPSLRYKEDDKQFRVFNVTPEFQKYVGNQLSQKLEKYLQENLTECCNKLKKRRKTKNRVKLLSISKHPIDMECEKEEQSVEIKQVRPKPKKEEVISESDLKSIVVTGEEVLSKKEIKNWSKRTKKTVFQYVKDKQGVLKYIEPEFK